MSKNNMLPNLNPLRGFLALTVVLLHIPLMTKNFDLPYFNEWPIFNRGYEAVWVFFSLSGFLIIRLLFVEKKKSTTIQVKEFYLRRIYRIYPVYYLILGFGLVYYLVLLPNLGVEYKVTYTAQEALFWCVAFLPNVFFSLHDPGGILSVLWSIGIEEQFYLIIAPISKWIKTQFFGTFLFVFTIVWFVLYFVPSLEFLRSYRMQYFYFTAGGLLAILHEQQKIPFLILKKIPRALLYCSFLIYFFTDWLHPSSDLGLHLISLVIFPLSILNLSHEKEWIIQSKLAEFLGEISYGIYMYHMIALNAIIFMNLQLRLDLIVHPFVFILLLNLSTILLTILLATLSYHLIEKKCIALKKRTFLKTKNHSHFEKSKQAV
jgi:peptidoglycan/LPS O-acetylase OafA/YrhL